jgi:hypothetical protein
MAFLHGQDPNQTLASHSTLMFAALTIGHHFNDPGCVKTRLLCYDSLVILRGKLMRRFVEQADRGQWTLLPECLDDFIDESNPDRSSGKQAFIGGETHFRQ